MSAAAEALLKCIDAGEHPINIEPSGSYGVIAMQDCTPLVSLFHAHNFSLWCPFYPWAKTLSNGFKNELSKNLPFDTRHDAVWVFPSKQKDETLYLIACALASLKEGGQILVAAANDAGGNRLKKILDSFGVCALDSYSKNKCKILTGTRENLNKEQIDNALQSGEQQSILDEQFTSQIGLYGWDKADKGSQLLVEHLPTDLFGRGTDFGCGYGFITRHTLDTNPKVKMLYAIDAEHRALDLAQINCAVHKDKMTPIWDDLSNPDHLPKNLDFVIMNPPFHSGKATDTSIGQNFIKNAHTALKRYGKLYLVANTQLPYETVVSKLFFKHSRLALHNGFKVIYAEK